MQTACLLLLAALLGIGGDGVSRDTEFKDLDGVSRRPLDPADKVGSVLVFYWHDCPISNSYAPELNRLAASYTNFSFYIVQVDPDLSLAAAKEHARQFNLRIPVLLDPQHRLVKHVEAVVTPEAVVLGKRSRVVYRGRIDDGYTAPTQKRGAVTERDLMEALDALAAGKAPLHAETKPIGCLIP